MTDQKLTELLERVADRTHVSPPPLDDMLARSRHVRRRRTVLLTAAASAAVVAVVGGTAALIGPGGGPQRDPAPADTSVSPSPTTERLTSAPLTGTWTVRALVGATGQSVLPVPYAHKVKMTFKDGGMTGTTGCNDVFGTYEQGGDRGQNLVFPRAQLGSTLVGCDEPPLVTRLLDVRHVSGSGDVRYLHAANWMIVAELRRRPEVTGPLSSPSQTRVKVTRCSDVWLPDEGVGEADFGVDAARGLLDIHFSATRSGKYRNFGYTVAYLKDPSCRSTRNLAELIDRVNPPGW